MPQVRPDPNPAPAPERPPELRNSELIKKWSQVDEASWESFPASDAPAYRKDQGEAPPTLNGEVEEESGEP